MSSSLSNDKFTIAEDLKKTGELCFQGFLKKRSRGATLTGKLMKSWRERQILLYKSKVLVYYSEEGNTSEYLRGVFDLNNASVSRVKNKKKIQDYEDSGSVHILRIVSAEGEKLVLAADADWRIEKWIEQLKAVIAGSWVPDKVLIRKSATGGKLTDPKVLTMLLDYVSSNLCADCGAQNPTWASINIGVLVCTACSGVHRSLGVHISFIQSVKMDYWTEEGAIKLIEKSGGPNVALNEIYEYHVPHGRKYVKPNAQSPRDIREKFIRHKYVDKLFGKIDPNDSSVVRDMLMSEVDTEHEIPDANALDGLDSDDDHEVEKEYSGNADGDESDEGSDSDVEYGSMSTSIIKEEAHKDDHTLVGETEFVGVLLVNPIELRIPWNRKGSIPNIFHKMNSALQNGGKPLKKKWYVNAKCGLQSVINSQHDQTKIKRDNSSSSSSSSSRDAPIAPTGLQVTYQGAPLMLSWDGESPLFISAVELETRMGKNTTPSTGAIEDGRKTSTADVDVKEYLPRLEEGETIILDLPLAPLDLVGDAVGSAMGSSKSVTYGLVLLTLSFTRLA